MRADIVGGELHYRQSVKFALLLPQLLLPLASFTYKFRLDRYKSTAIYTPVSRLTHANPLNSAPYALSLFELLRCPVARDFDPVAGQWYKDLEDQELFQVLSVDPDEELLEVQFENGDIEEIDLDTWHELDLELATEPEGWSGSDDDDDDDDWDEEEEEEEDDSDDDWDDDEDDDWEDDDDDIDDEYNDRN
jgi:hypothetical protein